MTHSRSARPPIKKYLAILGLLLAIGAVFALIVLASSNVARAPAPLETSTATGTTIKPMLAAATQTAPTVNTLTIAAPTAPLTGTPAARAPDDAELRATLARMTMPDKVAQMLMVGFRGLTLAGSPDLNTLVRQYHVGGILFNTENAHDPKQIAQLTAQTQTLALQSGARVPLLVSINHEGGIVVRIASGVTGFPGQMALGATQRADYAYNAAAKSAIELRALGINMNLAPVLDVNDQPFNPIIGTRSFGESPDLVIKLGRETIRGLQSNGVIATAKHFPGHGSATVDSHIGLPMINKSLADLERVELPPFQMAVGEGIDAIMTAHIVVPALDNTPGLPATLSNKILTGLLRTRYKYQGVIVTDSLGMSAITARGGLGRAAVEAVNAGADLIIVTSLADAQSVHKELVAAVQRNEITEARLTESVLRLLRLKAKYRLDAPTPASAVDQVGIPAHQALADEIADNSITLLKDSARLIPLAPSVKRLQIVSPTFLLINNSSLVGDGLRARGFQVTERFYNLDDSANRASVFAETLKSAAQFDQTIYVEWELVKRAVNDNDTSQETLLKQLQAAGVKPIVLSMHNPASILRLPDAPTFVALYGNQPAQSRAAVKLLLGEIKSRGQIPLTLKVGN